MGLGIFNYKDKFVQQFIMLVFKGFVWNDFEVSKCQVKMYKVLQNNFDFISYLFDVSVLVMCILVFFII